MSTWYALYGEASGELISYRGAVLVHDDGNALQREFPRNRVVPVDIPSLGRRVLKWTEHPEWDAASRGERQ